MGPGIKHASCVGVFTISFRWGNKTHSIHGTSPWTWEEAWKGPRQNLQLWLCDSQSHCFQPPWKGALHVMCVCLCVFPRRIPSGSRGSCALLTLTSSILFPACCCLYSVVLTRLGEFRHLLEAALYEMRIRILSHIAHTYICVCNHARIHTQLLILGPFGVNENVKHNPR